MARKPNLHALIMQFLFILACTSLLASTGCRTTQPRPEVPAVIVRPTGQSRSALANAVSLALDGGPVMLADDALTKTNILVIERSHPRAPDGLPMDGRERVFPDRFELVKSGPDCILVYTKSGRRLTLPRTECTPQ